MRRSADKQQKAREPSATRRALIGSMQCESNLSDLIPEKRPIQQQLADTQSILQTFFDLSPVIMGVIELEDDDLRFIFLNQATYRFYGLDKCFLGKTGHELNLPNAVIDLWVAKMKECQARQSCIHFEYERDLDDDRRYLAVTMTLLGQGPSGNPRFSYILQDHTTLTESERQLSLSEQRFNLAQEFAVVGCWDMDIERNTISWSDAMLTVFGIPKADMPRTTQSFLDLIHPDDREPMKASLEVATRTGEPHRIEFRVPSKVGTDKWVEGRGKAIFENGTCTRMIGVALDITQRKESEALTKNQSESMIYLSKMSALGEMAGGIAHEINNPLTILRGAAAVIKKELGKKDVDTAKLQRLSSEIDQTCDRVARIIDGLRFFARDGSLDNLQLVQMNDIVQDTLGFCLARFQKHGITLNFYRHEGSCPVFCKPVQISQVLLNVLNNAHDALERCADKTVNIIVESGDTYTTVKVEDSGRGIDSAMLENVFKPFFTTKEAGKGTGLGLSIAKGIIEAHSGTIEYSRKENMSCFTITLPKAGDL